MGIRFAVMGAKMTRLLALSLVIVACALAGCDAGSVGNNNNNPNDYDPLNPPDPPFPDNPFPDDGTCGDINAIVNGTTPTIHLVVDQSGSMDSNFGSTNRWDAVYRTLMEDNGMVSRLQSGVRFGLTLYTSDDGNAGGVCPMLQSVQPKLDNFNAMNAIIGPARPEGDTPTGETINAVTDTLVAVTEPGPKIIIVATDGEPDTCEIPNPSNDSERSIAQNASITAAQRAFDKGIRTYVISVGDDVGADHLQQLANVGTGLPPAGGTGGEQADYYVALNADDLVNAFGAIVGGVTGCVFTINGEVDPAKAGQGLVSVDGEPLEQGTDWVMLDSKTFEVIGAACDALQDGDLHHLSAVFPCGVIIID